MAGLKDIAKQAGVSITTASIILNNPERASRFSEECCKRVKGIATKLNYTKNKRGPRKRTEHRRGANLEQVAKAAGVSISTASVILNGSNYESRFSSECIQRVKETASRLMYYRDYRASLLQSEHANALGIVFGGIHPKDNLIAQPYWAALIGGIEHECRSLNKDLVFIASHEDQPALRLAQQYFGQHRIDGILVPVVPTPEDSPLLQSFPGPAITINTEPLFDFHVICQNEALACEQTLRHLIEIGHTEVAYLYPDRWSANASILRKDIFIETAQRLGLSSRAISFPSHRAFDQGLTLSECARKGMENDLKSHPLPMAICCFNDHCAHGLYECLNKKGIRVPQDVSVIGYDDFHASYFMPALTTINPNLFEIGKTSTRLLFEYATQFQATGKLPKRNSSELRQIEPSLIIRDSTAPPPRKS